MSDAAPKRSAEISVIIPTLNEGSGLAEVIARIESAGEIIVVDGGSSDNTVAEARRLGATVIETQRGRARQMNAGAAVARGSILLFLHADTWLPAEALENISRAMNGSEVAGGGFARRFRTDSIFLKATCCLAELRNRGIGWHFGDQAMFCWTSIFRELGGFKEMRAFEDVDFSRRLARCGRLVTLTPPVLSSARRFEEGPLKRTLKDLLLTVRYLIHPKAFFVACALLALCSNVGAAERIAQWRLFRTPEMSGALAVTLSPRGRLLVGHSDMSGITIFDGYSSRPLALPEGVNPPRVHESRSGQFWCAYKEGLYLFQRGQWTAHSIPEIAQELSRPRSRALSVVPAEVNRVLFLVADRLMEYDAGTFRASTLKQVSETGLGQFLEMIESADSGLLVSGANGVSRVAGPLRHLNARTPWQEFLVPTNSSVHNVQRPAEMRDGSIMAISFDTRGADFRRLLVAGPGGWKDEEFGGAKIRLAWPGWAGTRWGSSFDALHRYTGNLSNLWVREGVADTYYDVAVHTNGVFWLATSSGLMRYAPLLWRAPAEMSAAQLAESPSLAMAHGENSVWIAAPDALVQLADGKAERIPWPEYLESPLPPVDSIHEVRDGHVLISIGQRVMLFDARAKRFGTVRRNEGGEIKPIGEFRDGSICIRVLNGTDGRLERFDGVDFKTFLPSLRSNNIPSDISFMHETRAGEFWFGGSFGLAHLNLDEPPASIFGPGEGMERIQCVAEIGDDKIWAGGVDAIFELRGERFERVKGGLERVHSILRARDGSIWVSAANGVHRFQNGAWISYGDDEGLPSLATHDLAQDRRGRIWLATNRGAVIYDPEADTEEPRTQTPAILERDTEDGRSLTIQFFGADRWDYTSANRLLFSHRLDEGPWTAFTNSQTASFTNLGAGPHYIQSRAMDRNGNQDPAIATLEFAVTLPWSRDPRLIGVLILAAGVTLFLAGVAVNRHLRLKRSYAEVEQMVAERTAQLEKANQELLHAQKMRALGTLAAGIAHDFNNILSIIKGSAQIIETNPDDKEKVLTRVNRIQTVVEQGAGIVRSMLGLGKGGDQTACDPVELVDETVRLLGDRFPPEVIVRHEKTGTIPQLTCSKGVIHQILLNLILNAVDASNGKGTIILRTRIARDLRAGLALQPAHADSYVAIDVVDQGVGIPSEALPRIFEPFFTTKAFSSRRGTGLGLSMVYELAKGMGYGLAVESAPNQGSTFTLLAPVA